MRMVIGGTNYHLPTPAAFTAYHPVSDWPASLGEVFLVDLDLPVTGATIDRDVVPAILRHAASPPKDRIPSFSMCSRSARAVNDPGKGKSQG